MTRNRTSNGQSCKDTQVIVFSKKDTLTMEAIAPSKPDEDPLLQSTEPLSPEGEDSSLQKKISRTEQEEQAHLANIAHKQKHAEVASLVEKIRQEFIDNCLGKADTDDAIRIACEQLNAHSIGGVHEKIASFIDAAQAESIQQYGRYITSSPQPARSPVPPPVRPVPAPKPQPLRAPVVLTAKAQARKAHLEQKKIVDEFRPKYEKLLTGYSFEATQELATQCLMEQGIPAERIPKILGGIDKALRAEYKSRMNISA